METKNCAICKKDKSLSKYYKNRRYKDGVGSYCKSCSLLKTKEWQGKNAVRNKQNQQRWHRGKPNYYKNYYNKNNEKIKIVVRAWQEKNRERVRELAREWAKNNRFKSTLSRKRNRAKYPEKYHANNQIYIAKCRGDLISKPCFCGETKTEAHHPDYSKPLEVIWLCRKHHGEEHEKMKSRK